MEQVHGKYTGIVVYIIVRLMLRLMLLRVKVKLQALIIHGINFIAQDLM